MNRKISWPQYCRAESSATAYRTSLDWIRRRPVAEVIQRLEEKIKEKEEMIKEYRKQQDQVASARIEKDYQRANATLDE